MSVTPSPEQMKALLEDGPEGPIVMVNLLKFRAKAQYESSRPEAKDNISGAEAYQRYGASVQTCIAEVVGPSSGAVLRHPFSSAEPSRIGIRSSACVTPRGRRFSKWCPRRNIWPPPIIAPPVLNALFFFVVALAPPRSRTRVRQFA